MQDRAPLKVWIEPNGPGTEWAVDLSGPVGSIGGRPAVYVHAWLPDGDVALLDEDVTWSDEAAGSVRVRLSSAVLVALRRIGVIYLPR
jgi:hypothetical protein